MATLTLTPAGEQHSPRTPHHFAAWGGIKEMLRVHGGRATREQLVEVLQYCWHPDPQFCPNVAYLDYAVRQGWLAASE